MKSLAFLALAALPLMAQFSRPIVYFPTDPAGAPGGACQVQTNFWNNYTNNNLWKCVGASTNTSGVWTLVSTGGGGTPTFGNILSGTNTTAAMVVGAGGSLTFTSSGFINVNRIMGVTLSTLTGVVKFSSGVPAVVTGSSGDCVHVDASSAPCGGASTALQGLGTITTPPTIDGGSTLTTKTIGATLGASVACGTLQNFTSGEFLLLSLTQDGTGL